MQIEIKSETYLTVIRKVRLCAELFYIYYFDDGSFMDAVVVHDEISIGDSTYRIGSKLRAAQVAAIFKYETR